MPPVQLTDASFAKLVTIIYDLTGVSIDDSKRSLLRNRLGRRVRALGIEGLEEYIELISSSRKGAEEVASFVDVVTTHKTSFFRTPSLWNAVESELSDRLAGSGPVRAWSAACSNGQEPYSLAILLEHLRGSKAATWKIRASDVSKLAVKRAKAGEYDAQDVQGAENARPDWGVPRHFEACGEKMVVKRELRERIQFSDHNLLHPPRGTFDIVFLRNVIIYFSEEDTRRVIGHAIDVLEPGGLLVIGESESIGNSEPRVSYEGPCLYRKK